MSHINNGELNSQQGKTKCYSGLNEVEWKYSVIEARRLTVEVFDPTQISSYKNYKWMCHSVMIKTIFKFFKTKKSCCGLILHFFMPV